MAGVEVKEQPPQRITLAGECRWGPYRVRGRVRALNPFAIPDNCDYLLELILAGRQDTDSRSR
jgi:hypothetical protein